MGLKCNVCVGGTAKGCRRGDKVRLGNDSKVIERSKMIYKGQRSQAVGEQLSENYGVE